MEKTTFAKATYIVIAAVFFTAATIAAAGAQQTPQPNGPRPGGSMMQPPPGGPGMDMPGPGQPSMPPQPLSDEEAAKILSSIKDEDSTLYSDLLEMRDKNSDAFKSMLNHYRMEKQNLERLKNENPEAYQDAIKMRDLNRKERELAKKYRDAGSEVEKRQIGAELKPVLEELFDLNLAQRKNEIEFLEKRIKEVKEEVEKRKNNKDQIIERHFEEITGTGDNFRW